MNLYGRKDWLAFRAEVLRLDEARCSRCFVSSDQGARLHVHHKYYIMGRKPWEYPYDACEVFCQSCHAQEHGIIPPKTEWEFVGYEDLGEPSAHCEYCDTEIRHVYMIQHPRWVALEVGAICCDNLTATNNATEHMKERRRFLDRQKRFVSRWSNVAESVPIQCGKISVRVVRADAKFRLQMNGRTGRLCFASPLDAKLKAFEIIDSGIAARYFSKQLR